MQVPTVARGKRSSVPSCVSEAGAGAWPPVSRSLMAPHGSRDLAGVRQLQNIDSRVRLKQGRPGRGAFRKERKAQRFYDNVSVWLPPIR